MVTEYITLKAGERLRVSDQVFIADEQSWKTIDRHVAKYGMLVAPGSLCRRPVGVSAPDDAAGEWKEEEKEDRPTLEEELTKTNEYLQRTLKENMELHNRLQRMQEHVDSLKKQIAALEERMKAGEKLHDELMVQARAERLKLTNERHVLQHEVHNLQHSLAVERRRLESLDVGSVEQPETEVEKLARELFSRIPDLSAENSFYLAETWIAERDRRRKESGK